MRPRCRWYQQSPDNLYQFKEQFYKATIAEFLTGMLAEHFKPIAESLTGMLAEHIKPIAESLTGMLAEHFKQVDEHFARARAVAEGL